jgi:hypothetical protein
MRTCSTNDVRKSPFPLICWQKIRSFICGLTTMRFAALALSSLLARSALSFAPATTTTTALLHNHKITSALLFRGAKNTRSSSSSTQLHAHKKNVAKLSDPERQLLDKVDVFIFDCDGVIWRVRKQ